MLETFRKAFCALVIPVTFALIAPGVTSCVTLTGSTRVARCAVLPISSCRAEASARDVGLAHQSGVGGVPFDQDRAAR